APSSENTFIGGREIIRKAFLNKGLTEAAAELMVNSVSSSTLKQYECSLKQWYSFTKEKGHDMFNTNTSIIIEFLTKRFQEGAKYGTLNSDKSAIALITAQQFSSDKLISRFMRGVFKKRPTKPKYETTWNVDKVLDFIQ
ncbi:hypothetical protein EAG_00292, partial [Camponotus floridanus]